MDPEQLLRQAQAALQRGASIDEVNARLQEATEGQFETLDALQSSVGGPAIDPRSATAGRSGAAVSDRAAQEEIANIQQRDAQRMTQGALEALRRGATLGEVEERLQETTGLESFETLQQLAAGEDPSRQEALQRTAERGGSAVGDFGRMAAQGATFGFGDELAGLGAGVAAAVQGEDLGEAREEATGASRQRLEDTRRLNPGASLASEAAGAVGTGLLGAGAASRALGGRSARGLLTAGPEVTPFRLVQRAAGRGGAFGTAEGGLFAAGEAEGGVGERAVEAATSPTTLASGLAGVTLGTAGVVPGIITRSIKRTPKAGETLAQSLLDITQGGRRVPPSRVRARAAQKKGAAREIFQELEASGEPITKQPVLEVVEQNPVVQEALSPRARFAVEKLQSGETVQGEELLTFTQVDDAASNLKRTMDAFKRGDPNVRAEDVRRASQAFDELDTAMRESLDDFPEAKQLWAEANAEMRSLSEGRKVWGQQADDIQSALANAEDPEAFKLGLRNEVVEELREFRGSFARPPEAVKKFFKRGEGFEDQLRLLFDSDEQFERFARQVDLEKAATSMADKSLTLAQAATFLAGGTSLFGRLIG